MKTFEQFREVARTLLAKNCPPEDVHWDANGQRELHFDNSSACVAEEPAVYTTPTQKVPPEYVRAGQFVAAHRDEQKWNLLYRILWRITHGEKRLLENPADDDTLLFRRMEKQVKHDRHKMHAHVRFRKVEQEDGEWYVAWYRPDHLIVPLAAPFFIERFASMRWAILTPDESVWWDGERATFGEGISREAAGIGEDGVEDLWKTYYGAIFNPARVNVKLMRQHMAARHWPTLPEAQIIPKLLAEAPARVNEMAKRNMEWPTARPFLPEKITLPAMREAVQGCQGCPLYQNATQAVFGEGKKTARVMLVGEQPGNDEDLAGKPFVGPAGKILDEALEAAGIDRNEVYVTNAVKHFKWEPRGKRRLHSKPNNLEMQACRPWLEAEVAVVKPEVIVCLGATAAASVIGPAFKITKQHGEVMETSLCAKTTATFHPSTVLRGPTPEAREEKRREIIEDLKNVEALLAR